MVKKVKSSNRATSGGQADELSGRSLISEGNLDQVREILFGAQLKEHDKRFADLENLIKTELDHFQNDFQSRLGMLEDYIRSEVQSISGKLKKEQTERIADTERHDHHKQATQQRLSDLEEQLDTSGREMREMILKQCKNITNTAEKNYETLKNALVEKANELHEAKTDRTALAAMFSEMAIRLGLDLEDDKREAG